MLLSIIVPVYNRPHEVRELLESLTQQEGYHDYEIIIIEDGSTNPSGDVVQSFERRLPHLTYQVVPNGGPSKARNTGARLASGEYLLILDSDVVLPPQFLQSVAEGIATQQPDAWGGPDAAAPDFSPMQKAISYAMTSMLTTGGIRGGKASGMEQFKPRTFNMGCRRQLFLSLGGFSEDMRYGEDIDFSIRLIEAGARVILLPKAYVYHKRRVDLRQFFQQVRHSGQARIALERRHPGSMRLVHALPALFTLLSFGAIFSPIARTILVLYACALFVDALARHRRDWAVAIRAVPASFVQLWGYGIGFIEAWFRR